MNKELKEKIDSLESQLDFIGEQNKYIEKLENRINKAIDYETLLDILKGDNK